MMSTMSVCSVVYSFLDSQPLAENSDLAPVGYWPPAPADCSPWGVNPTSQPMAVI
jgi:hypothetical protein